ncbi:phenylalanine--tRNA ligase subunit beta [Legionella erythra]|uniref:Phenylalanine--tRNA ligase beta subunit n=1 Tax=Legionella erythra TaxID=448 RepID=A0A0W0TQJ3_LEGER|nr:phenylalanine--tRNA ligase subunit beta [Legionella erythra]KTC97782.1 phenylalanyl-tRNA synthetase subunit beta [Legionella erythra]
MKVSEIWLREWVNPAKNAQELAALLTMAGLEVDAVNPVAGAFDKVIVAQVKQTMPHPQADKLTLCEVETGSGKPLKVVCGASNVCAGLKVALAQVGATLPGGLTIKESTLRGELSQGMLCSASELGLADTSEGIIELDEDAPVGQDLRDYLMLNDQVLDIDLTPNRADCLSVLGIAREVAAISQLPFKRPASAHCPPAIDEEISLELHDKEGCPQYYGRVIRGINPQAKTPLWMRERLRRSGIRAIHPVVDITNYVMLELGQPMHAFDLKQVVNGIRVRKSHPGEMLELLDGQQAKLTGNELVIANASQPLAIAGVMGGSHSGVTDTTVDIFLESAFFNPVTIAGVARRYGLSTDSSQRFERGVDPALQGEAIERATELLLAIAGGKPGPVSRISHAEHLPQNNAIALKPGKVKQLTGIDVTPEDMLKMLTGLGMQVDSQGAVWKVMPPSHRFDMRLDVDLIEEIVRLYGYDRIPGDKMITTVQAGVINPLETLARQLSQFFMARGYHETISYSFVDPELQAALYPEKETMTLLNPISSELSQMRTGMWPGLIASMVYNMHRQQPTLKLFENGVIFEVTNGQLTEQACFAGLLTGQCGALSWLEPTRPFDFYDAKGDLEALFAALHLQGIAFQKAEHDALHPGKSTRILCHGQPIGWCGVLHPRLAQALDVTDEVILFELTLQSLGQVEPVRYQTISKFPQIRRDLSLLVDDKVAVSDIESLIQRTVANGWLKSFDVFDVYTGGSIPAGKKSIAIALTLQDDKRTLIDHEINEIISAIIKKLDEEFAITLRE